MSRRSANQRTLRVRRAGTSTTDATGTSLVSTACTRPSLLGDGEHELRLERGGEVRDLLDLASVLQKHGNRLAAAVERRIVVALLEALDVHRGVEKLRSRQELLVSFGRLLDDLRHDLHCLV